MAETTLSGMKAIQEHCRAVNLPSSEVTILQMIRESEFPARKLGGIWMSDAENIAKWLSGYIAGEITSILPGCKAEKQTDEGNRIRALETKYAMAVLRIERLEQIIDNPTGVLMGAVSLRKARHPWKKATRYRESRK